MESDSKGKDTDAQSTVVAKMQSLDHQISIQMEETATEIESKNLEILNHEAAIELKRAEVKELTEFKSRLEIMHSYLTGASVGVSIKSTNTTTTSRVEHVAKSISEEWYDTQRAKIKNFGDRFWERKSFDGWPTFLRTLIGITDSFLSVYDVLTLINEADIERRKKIESAINNAFSTGTKSGKFGGINFKELSRRFYGTRDLFIEDWPSEEHQNLLRHRLELDTLEISDVILNRPTPINSAKLFDYTEKFVQKNTLESSEDKK